jgi:hypothetical protein
VPSPVVHKVVLWLGIPYASIWFALHAPAIFRDIKGLDYSYGIYIYAWPVQQWVIQMTLPHGASLLSALLLSLLGTTALAGLSWHLIERPALRLKPRRHARASATPGRD